MAAAASVTFSGDTFERLFPFHVIFAADGTVRRVGGALAARVPSLQPGSPPTALTLEGGGALTAEALAASSLHAPLRLHVADGLALRGELAKVDGGDLAFLGSPWPIAGGVPVALPVSQHEYAAHDATPELHERVMTQKFALDGAHALAARLEQKHAELLDKQNTILQLSAPTIHLWNDVLAVPLVGMLDARRIETLMKAVAAHVTTHASRFVLVDLTGAQAVDTSTVRALGNLAAMARMLGAEFMLTGVAPEFAQTFVELGLDMASFQSFVALSDALRTVFAEQQGASTGPRATRERLARARARQKRSSTFEPG